MASIDDCFNQLTDANGHLVAIDGDLQTVNTSVQAVNTSVQAMDADVNGVTTAVQTGFSQLGSLVNYTDQLVLYEIEQNKYTDQLLVYQIEQNDTIICYLAKIAFQTCALLNEAARQTAAQEEMRRDLADLLQLYELTNPAAAVEQDRLEALKEQIERCCPPPRPEPPCKFEKCDQPRELPKPPGALPQPPGSGQPQAQVQAKAPARKRS
jgi:hypothetical protein